MDVGRREALEERPNRVKLLAVTSKRLAEWILKDRREKILNARIGAQHKWLPRTRVNRTNTHAQQCRQRTGAGGRHRVERLYGLAGVGLHEHADRRNVAGGAGKELWWSQVQSLPPSDQEAEPEDKCHAHALVARAGKCRASAVLRS
jgi:hypothetical protein